MRLDIPPGWRLVREWGPGPFITHADIERPDGVVVCWSSRRHRKRLGLVSDTARQRHLTRPSAISIWMGGLFAIGSVCFALGSLPAYFDTVSASVTAWTFFVGSIFFTTAAYLQYHETTTAPTGLLKQSGDPRGWKALVHWDARRIDWWASAIQFAGTIMFNITTFAGTRGDLSLQQERHLIWAPDIGGSVCFLIASWLAFSEVAAKKWWKPQRDLGWIISAANMIGSVAFGASAIGARYLRGSGDMANLALVNAGTFIGAICFLIGALLLPVESATETEAGN